MHMQAYLKNRIAFPLDELAKHRGEWIAWSPDGTRIIASSRDPDGLEAEVCVMNPDARPGVYNPPGTPSHRYHDGDAAPH